MKVVKVLEISIQEARQLLVDHLFYNLTEDVETLKLLLTEGIGLPYSKGVGNLNDDEVVGILTNSHSASNLAHHWCADIVQVRSESDLAQVIFDVKNAEVLEV